VWYAQLVSAQFDSEWVNTRLGEIPVEWQPEVLKYVQLNDRVRSLAGRLLLCRALDAFGFLPPAYQQMTLSKYRRPCISGLSAFDFNISHSEGYVLCAAIRNGRVGVDVESIRLLDFDALQSTLNAAQWAAVHQAVYPQAAFQSYWTAKEALVKADGRGLHLHVNQIEISYPTTQIDGYFWQLQALNISNAYKAHIAWSGSASKPQLIEVQF
jgi:4'-phosphopantetheinyl transferase